MLAETGEVGAGDHRRLRRGLRRLYDAETYTAKRLADMALRPMNDEADVDGLIASIEREQGIKYAPLQKHAGACPAQPRAVVLTGGPGTGKHHLRAGHTRNV